jgi:nitrite reductase (NO-forming)
MAGRVAVVAIVIVVLTGCTGTEASWTFAPTAAEPGSDRGASVEPASQADTAGAGTEGDPNVVEATHAPAVDQALGTIEIRGFDLGFEPASPAVPDPGPYLVRFVNDGAVFHDITFDDGTVIGADPGQSSEAVVEIPAAGVGFICSVPGHGPAGMAGTVTISGDAVEHAASPEPADGYGDAGSAAEDGHGGPAPASDVAADPAAPAPITYDATAPARLDGDVHDIDLVMTETLMTVAPGFVQQVWTFGGTVPGPVIRVKVGDTIRVHLVNPPENALSHSIDFHSSQVAWNDEMRSIAPGEELVYEWTADYAGVWMYHCGTAPTLHHIANGMYGMVIVEPAEGLPPVDAEFALLQSEWYLGPQGEPSSLEKAMAAAPAPDYVVFNGVADQYRDAPLTVGTSERVRIFVLNAGPSIDSSFHIVGTIFDTVIKEGILLARGNVGSWGSQAVDLAPAQGAIVEFTTAEDGLYPIVTHAFNLVGRGALGLVQAGDGEPG